jgi:hypothetical protein
LKEKTLFALSSAFDLIGEIIGYIYWAYNQIAAGVPFKLPF